VTDYNSVLANRMLGPETGVCSYKGRMKVTVWWYNFKISKVLKPMLLKTIFF